MGMEAIPKCKQDIIHNSHSTDWVFYKSHTTSRTKCRSGRQVIIYNKHPVSQYNTMRQNATLNMDNVVMSQNEMRHNKGGFHFEHKVCVEHVSSHLKSF